MRHLLYAMQFKGQANPANETGTVLKAATTAPSSSITTTVGADGIETALQPVPGDPASFQSEVTLTGETSFIESGTIHFGSNGHALRFSSIGQGYLGACPDPSLKHGSVMWRVEGGEGQFLGATGLITSNFFVSDKGEVTDNHYGVLFVP